MPSTPPKPRILVVEDEPSILDNVLYALASEGLDAVGVATGGEALAAFAVAASSGAPPAPPCDLLVLDVGLPDMTGFDLCRRLRRDHAIPIIFLTARGAEVDRIVGLEIGGDDYVVKPFSPRELAARVKAVLRRLPPARTHAPDTPGPPAGDEGAQPVRGTPFAIDTARARITFCDHALTLSSTEFRLLTTLCSHPGRVFSRSQLMDRAWEDPAAALERTVDAHVKSLRAKLKAIRAELDPIVTHRGLGYSLREDW